MKKTRVLCVDDIPEIATLLCEAIDREPDMTCVESLNDNKGLVERIHAHHADVLVLDYTMPGLDSLDVIADVVTRADRCRVIAYSGFDDPAICDAVFEAGGWGFVSKHEPHPTLINAIRAVMCDRTVFPTKRPDDGRRPSGPSLS